MCDWISDEVRKFPKTTKMWKVGGQKWDGKLTTGPCRGSTTPIIWNKWMRAAKYAFKIGFFGFNVVRTRALAEAFAQDYPGQDYPGPIYRVEVKGRYRKATSDEGRPCLLVEYVRFSRPKAKR